MTTMVERKSLRLLLLCCLAVGTPSAFGRTPGRAAADVPGFDCRLIAFSPVFDEDRTAFCAGLDVNVLKRTIQASFFVTQDGGETWRRTAAEGLATATTSRPEQLVVSPLFETDSAAFLHTDEGIWKTTDLGESFTLVDSLANPGVGRLAPIVETIGGERTVFAFANAELTSKIDPPLHVPMLAAPEPEVRFVIQDGTALVVTRRGGDPPQVVLFSCNAALVCSEKLFEFPEGFEFGNIWLGPQTDGSRSLFVETLRPIEPGITRPVLWRSDDGGDTYVEWNAVNRLIDPIEEAGGRDARVGLVHDPARPSRMLLRISYAPQTRERVSRSNPPGEQIFASHDGGETWKRIAYGLNFKQSGRPGTLPWNHVNQQSEAHLAFGEQGRLFALGETFAAPPDGYTGPFCSLDGARTWSKTCARAP